jgi:hypothetical protein
MWRALLWWLCKGNARTRQKVQVAGCILQVTQDNGEYGAAWRCASERAI